jgi:hypothetical protein
VATLKTIVAAGITTHQCVVVAEVCVQIKIKLFVTFRQKQLRRITVSADLHHCLQKAPLARKRPRPLA